MQGPVALQTRLYIEGPPVEGPPRLYWDGMLGLRNVGLRVGLPLEHVTGNIAAHGWFNGHRLDGVDGNLEISEASILNQPIRNIHGELLVSPDEPEVLKIPGLLAGYCGGQIYGPVRVEFGPQLTYELDLTATQIKLEEFGRYNFRQDAEINGLAVARLYLRGNGPELSGLRGKGRLDVPNGKLYNLPVLLDLLKFLSLRLPDRTFFEEAHAEFDIEGLRPHVRRLELYGNAISLRGQGDANLDGSDLALDFNVDWARLGQLLPAGVRSIPRDQQPAFEDRNARQTRGSALSKRAGADPAGAVQKDPGQRELTVCSQSVWRQVS